MESTQLVRVPQTRATTVSVSVELLHFVLASILAMQAFVDVELVWLDAPVLLILAMLLANAFARPTRARLPQMEKHAMLLWAFVCVEQLVLPLAVVQLIHARLLEFAYAELPHLVQSTQTSVLLVFASVAQLMLALY